MTSEDTAEWVVLLEDVEANQLRLALNLYERRNSPSQLSAGTSELLVDKFRQLRVEVFAREHPPPHFRVCVGGEVANYSIKDCTQLNGGLRRFYSVVKSWHAQNKKRLIDEWDRLRPSDCPVGAYREE